ncbi:MAG: hypothetical protein AB7P40_00135 [Chloroflexota bacterium]
MSLRLCDPLGGDWPFWPRCARCNAEITEGKRYAILPGTNTIWCAPCAGTPVEVEQPAPPRARPAHAIDTFGMTRPEREGVAKRRGFVPLPPGRWSRDYERCQQCGTTERPYQANGLCRTCWQRARGNGRPPMSASGRTCRECGRGDRPHKGRGLCSACWQTERRQRQEIAS